ncbi:TetR/AcrR family transcriptional regulator [Comamonas humi]
MARKPVTVATDTRENLLRHAARMLGAHGYAATTMRAIAEQAGIEAASIYYHFASKEDLVEHVMAHGVAQCEQTLQAHLDALPAGANSRQRFEAAVAGILDGFVTHSDFAAANSKLLGQLPEKLQRQQDKRHQQHRKVWDRLLLELQAEGYLRPDVDLGLCRVFILGTVNYAQAWYNPRKGSIAQVAKQFCTVFFEGMAPLKVPA